MKKLIFVTIFLIAAAQAAFGQDNVAIFDKYVEAARQEWHVPGISVAVVKDGKVLLAALGEPWVPTHANKIIWSADSDFVLIAFDDGKYRCTCVYSFREQKLVSLSHVEDGWTVPIRWCSTAKIA